MIDHVNSSLRHNVRVRVHDETGFFKVDEWREYHWGASSDVFEVSEREGDKNYWAFEFTSLQSTPVRAFQRLSENYPNVQFHHRYFGVGEQIAGEISYTYGQPTTEIRFEGHAYDKLMSTFGESGIILRFDSGDCSIRYNQNFKGETIDPKLNGKIVDKFSCIYGGNFSDKQTSPQMTPVKKLTKAKPIKETYTMFDFSYN